MSQTSFLAGSPYRVADRYARRFRARATADELVPLLNGALKEMDQFTLWLNRFDRILVAARLEAPELKNRVWQDRFVDFFNQKDAAFEWLQIVHAKLYDIILDAPAAEEVAEHAMQLLNVPRKAQIEYAISDIDFAPNPLTGRDGISYSIQRLKEWADNAREWIARSRRELKSLIVRANKIVNT